MSVDNYGSDGTGSNGEIRRPLRKKDPRRQISSLDLWRPTEKQLDYDFDLKDVRDSRLRYKRGITSNA